MDKDKKTNPPEPQNQDQTNQTQRTQQQEPQNFPDPEKLLQEKLKELGFNSLEELKELKEKAEKASQQAPEDKKLKEELNKLQTQIKELETAYRTEKVRVSIITSATKLGVIDPDMVFLLAKEKAEVRDGKVLIDGKPVEDFLKELKEKKPYLFKASDKEGSGAGVAKEPQREKSTDEKLSKLLEE